MADDQSESGDAPSEKERTKTFVRRAGRVLFIGSGFVLFVTMMVGVVRGIQQDRAWNPYTGRPHDEGDCLRRARKLMLDAGELDRLSGAWMNRYREWGTDCGESHPELRELLERTHTELQQLGEDDE